jgi:hypothetical protein
MAGVPIAAPQVQYLDANGIPLAMGFVYTYAAGTTNLATTWEDRAQTAENDNPIELDATGSASILLDPGLYYRIVVTDKDGVIQSHLGGDNMAGAAGAQVLAEVIAAGESAVDDIEAARDAAVIELGEVGAAASLASATAGAYPNSAATNVPRGLTQASVGAITPGSGGANGTFALGWSGGNFTHNPTGTFTVAGGALTAVTITGPGLYIGAAPTVPTPSFTASAGLTGAAVALTAQFLVTAGNGYWVQSTDGTTLERYKNVAGVATRDTGVEPLPTVNFDPDDDFPGNRNLYGPILTPRTKDLAGSNFDLPFPPDAKFTVTAGTGNDYSAAIDGLVPGAPFIIYIIATSGVVGVTTFTLNTVQALTELRRGLWMWEGTVPALTTTATIVVKNGSAGSALVGYVRYATGPVGATGAAPQDSALAVDSFFDSGMPSPDQELLRAEPAVMAPDATSALVTVTSAVNLALGDTVAVLAHAETLAGTDATINDVSLSVTATSTVSYSLFPLAEHPGWWYREIYLDPTAYTGPTITQVRTSANNHNNSNHYDETARQVTHFIYRNGLPRFYPSAAPDEGKGIQHRGNMRHRTWSTSATAAYNGNFPSLFGGMRRLWVRSAAGGDYLVVRKNADTGDFFGATLAITHAGGGWKDFTASIPAEWKLPRSGFVVGLAPNAGGTPGLLEYATTVVGDTVPTGSSWNSGTADGDDVTFFTAGQDRFIGLYVEVEDRPGAVKRMAPTPLTRTGPADYQLDFILGQSGYEGYALNSGNFADYSRLTPAASLMWNRNQAAWVPLHDPVGQNNPVGGSLWPSYAKEFEERMKSRANLVVDCAFGGTNIAGDWWSSSTGAKAKWTAALADYDAALDAAWAANLPISAVVVHIDLGEGDGLLGTSGATFKTHLVSWIAEIRNLVSPYVPIFYRPPGRGAAADVANFAQIRKAIQEVANADPYFHIASNGEVITEYRGMKLADHYHDNLAAQEESGRLLAALTPVPASKAMPKDYTLDVARP